jgi:hypothetical protein
MDYENLYKEFIKWLKEHNHGFAVAYATEQLEPKYKLKTTEDTLKMWLNGIHEDED